MSVGFLWVSTIWIWHYWCGTTVSLYFWYDDQNLCLKATKFMCWIWLEGRVGWSEAKKYGLAPSRTICVGYGLVGYWRWSLWYYILWQLIKITGWTEGCHCVNFVRATFGQGHCLGFFLRVTKWHRSAFLLHRFVSKS